MARTASGVFIARSISSTGLNIQNVTNAPAASKGHQLDDGFGRDRQHQAVLVFGRVGLPGSEQHREGRHRQRHDQRDIADDRNAGERLVLAQDRFERRRHRLELQRDVGNRADDRDQGDGRRDGLALAVARAR